MTSSAQLRAARAYLDWTIDKTAAASGLSRRTIIRLENDEYYAEAQPRSLTTLVSVYRQQRLILDGNVVVMDISAASADRARGLA